MPGVHVDGAFGLWAAAAPSKAHLLAGYDAADSWATDAHKYLNTPYDSGLAFVRDPDALRAAMAVSAAYLPQAQHVIWPATRPNCRAAPAVSRSGRRCTLWDARASPIS
ncbi:MAG: pyridoxal-dependent decarboxylase [Ktedonobacterales bacterium]